MDTTSERVDRLKKLLMELFPNENEMYLYARAQMYIEEMEKYETRDA